MFEPALSSKFLPEDVPESHWNTGGMGGHLLVSVLPNIVLINDRKDHLFFQHILAVVDILPMRLIRALLQWICFFEFLRNKVMPHYHLLSKDGSIHRAAIRFAKKQTGTFFK